MSRRYNKNKKSNGKLFLPPLKPKNLYLLIQPLRHMPVRGISIKHLVPSPAYDEYKRQARVVSYRHCSICTDFVNYSKGEFFKYIESWKIHESETTRYYYFDSLYAVCENCYIYANPWYANILLSENKLNEKQLRIIKSKRDTLLQQYGVSYWQYKDYDRIYHIEHAGLKFINDSIPSLVPEAMRRGVNIIHLKQNRMVMPYGEYYWVD